MLQHTQIIEQVGLPGQVARHLPQLQSLGVGNFRFIQLAQGALRHPDFKLRSGRAGRISQGFIRLVRLVNLLKRPVDLAHRKQGRSQGALRLGMRPGVAVHGLG